MIEYVFYLGAIILALGIIGAIGDVVGILTGHIHPWDFT